MTTLTATYTSKTSNSIGAKIAVVLRNIFIRFVQAHEAQAALLVADQHINGSAQLNRLANKLEASQPNLAAELRFIAARG